MSFASAVLTNAGKAIAIRGMSGEVINFTKIKIGKGTLGEGQNPKDLLDVIDPVSEAPIVNFVKKEDGIKIVASFQNAAIEDEFDWSEIGLFVKDPADENREILYAYQNAYEYAEHITPLNMVTRNLSINIKIDDTDSLTADQHRELVFATLEDFDNLEKTVRNYTTEMVETIEKFNSDVAAFYEKVKDIGDVSENLQGACDEAIFNAVESCNAAVENIRYVTEEAIKATREECDSVINQTKAECDEAITNVTKKFGRFQKNLMGATSGQSVDINVPLTEEFMFPPIDVLKFVQGATTQVNTNNVVINTSNFNYNTAKVKVNNNTVTFNTNANLAMNKTDTVGDYTEHSSEVMNVTNYRDLTNFVYSEV